MTLGEKIYQLRKERGWSQETLAEKLGTTRQAISKWENNSQGYPETEKLIQLSEIFGVSLDYLLKDEATVVTGTFACCILNHEETMDFLKTEQKMALFVGVGVCLFCLSGSPYLLFTQDEIMQFLGMGGIIALGIISLVLGLFCEKKEYQAWREVPINLEKGLQQELLSTYQTWKKRFKKFEVLSVIGFICSMLCIVNTVRGEIPWTIYHHAVFLLLGLSIIGLIYADTMTIAYEMLLYNEEYQQKLLVRIKHKIKKEIAKL